MEFSKTGGHGHFFAPVVVDVITVTPQNPPPFFLPGSPAGPFRLFASPLSSFLSQPPCGGSLPAAALLGGFQFMVLISLLCMRRSCGALGASSGLCCFCNTSVFTLLDCELKDFDQSVSITFSTRCILKIPLRDKLLSTLISSLNFWLHYWCYVDVYPRVSRLYFSQNHHNIE